MFFKFSQIIEHFPEISKFHQQTRNITNQFLLVRSHIQLRCDISIFSGKKSYSTEVRYTHQTFFYQDAKNDKNTKKTFW